MADFIIGDYGYTIIPNTTNVIARVTDTTKSSYSNIPSTVSYNGNSYTVTSLEGCFEDCTNLHNNFPTIPDTVTVLDYCFKGMTLDSFPTISTNVTSMSHCFQDCKFNSDIFDITIPEGVIDLNSCFADSVFYSDIELSISSTVRNMKDCFSDIMCERFGLVIPYRVEILEGCFYGSTIYYGDIIVLGTPTNVTDIFALTQSSNGIFIYTTTDTGNRNFWKQVVNDADIPSIIISNNYVMTDNLAYGVWLDDHDYTAQLRYIRDYFPQEIDGVNIPEYVMVDNYKWIINNLNYCFKNQSISEGPSIPSTVTDMDECFISTELSGTLTVYNDPVSYENCFAMTYYDIYINYQGINKYKPYINVWKIIADEYSNVTLLEPIGDYLYCPHSRYPNTTYTPTASVSVVDKTKEEYETLLELPNINGTAYSLADMKSCYEDCVNLKSVVYIPSNVKNISRAFYNCKSLSGSIHTTSIPTSYTECFTGTTKPIYIITYSSASKTAWETITASYNNIKVLYQPAVDTYSNVVNTITFGGYEESEDDNKIISYLSLECDNDVLIAGDEELISLIEDLNFDANSISS